MTELRRLLEGSDDEVERALFDAVRADRPGPSGLRDTALALGLSASTANALAATLPASSSLGTVLGADAAGGAVTSGAATGGAVTAGASGTVAALGSVPLGLLGKSLLGGTLVSFLALTTLDQTLGTSTKPELPASAVRSSGEPIKHPREQAHSQPTPPIAPATSADELRPSLEATSPSTGQRRASQRVAEPPVASEPQTVSAAPANAAFASVPQSQPAAEAAPSRASLAAEIRVLDQARAALAAGETVAASRLLDAYAANRPSSVLSQEAALLRVRLLLAQGRRPAAAELARRIIALHPESAHADSLRHLAAEP